jgi:CPA1 family monovalent cation:H+ antiporter
MEHVELTVFGILAAIAALAVLAGVLRVPYPILLVLGGLGLGFVPGVPEIELDPDLVLLIFLPPLLYGAAFFTSLRDLRANVRAIGMLSIGLVLVTMVAVAAVAHAAIGLSWPVAFALGAIVAPTDAVAPATILRRVGAPRRLVTIVEGENLTNDWTALVLYRFAVAAAVSGTFSLGAASLRFLLTGLGGVAVGLVAGRLIREARRRIDDPPIEITISLLSGYAAYLPAEELGVSGVIAAVTVGVYMGWHTPELTTPLMRIQGVSVWEVLLFLLNAILFLLVGLQMRHVLEGASGYSAGELVGWGLLVSAVVVAVRVAWQFTMPYVIRAVDRRPSQVARRTGWRERLVLGWCGMRGSVSLAAALALPLETDAGTPLPDRELVVFLAFSTILVTLVGQGLTLKPLIDWLGVRDDRAEEAEEAVARVETAQAALARLEELAGEPWTYADTVERVRALYDQRRRRFQARLDRERRPGGVEDRAGAYQRLRRELLAAERRRLIELRNRGAISDEVRRRVERDLDYDETRLEE